MDFYSVQLLKVKSRNSTENPKEPRTQRRAGVLTMFETRNRRKNEKEYNNVVIRVDVLLLQTPREAPDPTLSTSSGVHV